MPVPIHDGSHETITGFNVHRRSCEVVLSMFLFINRPICDRLRARGTLAGETG